MLKNCKFKRKHCIAKINTNFEFARYRRCIKLAAQSLRTLKNKTQNFLIKMTKQFRLEYYEYFFNYLIKHPELNILNFIPLELLTLDQKFDIFKELYRFLIAHKNLNMIDSKPLHEQYESFVFTRPRLKSDLEVFNDLEKGLQNIRIPTQNKISL